MYRKLITIISIPLLVAALVACSPKEQLSNNSVVGIGDDQNTPTQLDKWIIDSITMPYGIAIDYQPVQSNIDNSSFVYPPKVEKVQDVLIVLKELWLKLYQDPALGGKKFWKGMNPLKITLYGGNLLDTEGYARIDYTQGAHAEMSLFGINEFDITDSRKVYTLIRTVHHQYAKYLIDHYNYDLYQFSQVSANQYGESLADFDLPDLINDGYGVLYLGYYPKQRDLSECGKGIDFRYFDLYADCVQAHINEGIDEKCYFVEFTQEQPNKKGFFTYHSIFSPVDDFAEIVSLTVTNKARQINECKKHARKPIFSNIPDEYAQNKLLAEQMYNNMNQKQMLVEQFFKTNLGFTLKRMQLLSLQYLNKFNNAHHE